MIIKKSDVALVEEYNGTVPALWMDTFFTYHLNNYFELLEGKEWDAHQISEKSYIENIFQKNESKEEVKIISMTMKPVEYIQEAIKRVCEAVPMYQSFKDVNIPADDIKRYKRK